MKNSILSPFTLLSPFRLSSVDGNALPHLSTPRLDLRQRSEADVPALIEMACDPEVMRFVGDGRPCEPEAHRRQFLDRIHEDFGAGLGYWSVFPKGAPDRFMGWAPAISRSSAATSSAGRSPRSATRAAGSR